MNDKTKPRCTCPVVPFDPDEHVPPASEHLDGCPIKKHAASARDGAVAPVHVEMPKALGTLVITLQNGTERVLTLRSRRCRGVPVLEARDDAAPPGANDLWAVFELDDYPESVRIEPEPQTHCICGLPVDNFGCHDTACADRDLVERWRRDGVPHDEIARRRREHARA
jgi:hypothetical protein